MKNTTFNMTFISFNCVQEFKYKNKTKIKKHDYYFGLLQKSPQLAKGRHGYTCITFAGMQRYKRVFEMKKVL